MLLCKQNSPRHEKQPLFVISPDYQLQLITQGWNITIFLSHKSMFLSRNNPVRSGDRKELGEYPNIFFSRKWSNWANRRGIPQSYVPDWRRKGLYIHHHCRRIQAAFSVYSILVKLSALQASTAAAVHSIYSSRRNLPAISQQCNSVPGQSQVALSRVPAPPVLSPSNFHTLVMHNRRWPTLLFQRSL